VRRNEVVSSLNGFGRDSLSSLRKREKLYSYLGELFRSGLEVISVVSARVSQLRRDFPLPRFR